MPVNAEGPEFEPIATHRFVAAKGDPQRCASCASIVTGDQLTDLVQHCNACGSSLGWQFDRCPVCRNPGIIPIHTED